MHDFLGIPLNQSILPTTGSVLGWITSSTYHTANCLWPAAIPWLMPMSSWLVNILHTCLSCISRLLLGFVGGGGGGGFWFWMELRKIQAGRDRWSRAKIFGGNTNEYWNIEKERSVWLQVITEGFWQPCSHLAARGHMPVPSNQWEDDQECWDGSRATWHWVSKEEEDPTAPSLAQP